MILSNVILGLMITNSVMVDPFYDVNKSLFQENNFISKTLDVGHKNNLQLSSLVGYINLVQLIQVDIFEATKPNLNVRSSFQDDSGKEIAYCIYEEANTIADQFWQRNMWNEGFYCAILGMMTANYVFNQIDNTGTLSTLVNFGVQLAELTAISHWKVAPNTPKLNLRATLLVIQF